MLPEFLTNPNPRRYLDEDYIVIDFENTTKGRGLAIYPDNRVVVAGYHVGPGLNLEGLGDVRRNGVHRGGEFDQGLLVRMVERASFVVAHNAKFDLGWLARCGSDTSKILCYDTMLGEYVLGGNRWKLNQLSLEAIAQRRYGEGKLDTIKEHFWQRGIDTPDIPEEWLDRYCLRDIELTHRLFLDQRKDLAAAGLLHIAYLRNLMAPVLADIEMNGMQLDPELVEKAFDESNNSFVAAQNDLMLYAPINWNSGDQVAEFLYGKLGFTPRKIKKGGQWVEDRTDTGKYKTDIDTILALKATTKEQDEFKALFSTYNEGKGELTKYLNKFKECCDNAGGKLYAVQNQCNTQTHRLSSTGLEYKAQLHNINRAFKPLFKAIREGNVIGEGDAATLEFSTAVHLGRDRQGLADLINPAFDAHTVTASVIWPDKPTKEMRQPAKPHTFKPLYYGQSGTEAEQRYYKFFREKYKGISQWQERNIEYVADHKQLRTEWGLIFYWPFCERQWSRKGVYVKGSTQIANYPVQSFATADIVPMALVWMWHRLKEAKSTILLLNTVHDSIIGDMTPEQVPEWHDLCRTALLYDVYRFMESLYKIRLTVPLGCGVITGDHWGSKNESKYKVEDEWWMDAARAEGML